MNHIKDQTFVSNLWNFLSYAMVITALIGTGISYSKIYLFHIVIILFWSITLFRLMKDSEFRASIVWDHSLIFFIVFFAIYLLSAFWSTNLLNSLKYSSFVFMGSSIVLTIGLFFQNKERLRKLLHYIVIFYLVHLVVCLLEIFTPFRWIISPLSNYAVYFGKEVITTNSNNSDYMLSIPTSFFSSFNHTSFFTLLGAPFFLFHKKLLIKIVGSLSVLVIIYYANSRSLLVLYGVTLILYLLITLYTSQKKSFKKVIILFSVIFGIIGTMLFLFKHKKDDKRIMEMKQSLTIIPHYTSHFVDLIVKKIMNKDVQIRHTFGYALGERFIFINEALNQFTKSKWLGIGSGGLAATKFKKYSKYYDLGGIHHYWIEVLAEGGVFFFVYYILWFFFKVKTLFLSLRTKDKCDYFYGLSPPLFLATIIFFVGVVVLSSGIYYLPKWILYGLLVSVTHNLRYEVKKENHSKEHILQRAIRYLLSTKDSEKDARETNEI